MLCSVVFAVVAVHVDRATVHVVVATVPVSGDADASCFVAVAVVVAAVLLLV